MGLAPTAVWRAPPQRHLEDPSLQPQPFPPHPPSLSPTRSRPVLKLLRASIGQGHQTKASAKWAKTVQKMSENCVFQSLLDNFWEHFSDISSTFPFSGLSNDLPVTILNLLRRVKSARTVKFGMAIRKHHGKCSEMLLLPRKRSRKLVLFAMLRERRVRRTGSEGDPRALQAGGILSGKKKSLLIRHINQENPQDTGRVFLGHPAGQTGVYRPCPRDFLLFTKRKTDRKRAFLPEQRPRIPGTPGRPGVFRNLM